MTAGDRGAQSVRFPAPRATGNAHAKALIHRDLMRVAAQAGLTSMPQSVLSILIAEAWPHPHSRYWYCATTQRRLAERLSCHERTIQRAVAELRLHDLLRVTVNASKTKARYWLNDLVQPLRCDVNREPAAESAAEPAAEPELPRGAQPTGQLGHDTGVVSQTPTRHWCRVGGDTGVG